MISFRSTLVGAAVGVLLVVGMHPAGAVSVTVHAPTAGAHVHVNLPGGVQPNTVFPTTNIGAGYFVYPGTPNVSSVSAQFTVPAIACSTSNVVEGFFPGIWIYDASGTLTQQVDVNLYCSGGAAYLHDVICIAGASEACVQDVLDIQPGDRIIASFSESSYHTQGQLLDLRTGANSHSYDGSPAPTTDNTVFVGDAGPEPFGLSRGVIFSTIPFRKVQVDGYYLFEYGAQGYTLKTGARVQVRPSPLQGDGDAFTTTFVHV